MSKWTFFSTVLVAMCVYACAAETNDLFSFYRVTMENRNLTQSEREKTVQGLLGSLNRSDFLAFVRDAAKKEPRYADERSEYSLAMHFFATIYADGPGKGETVEEAVSQLPDPTLPSTWKIALLDVLRLNCRQNITESELVAVTRVLGEAGRSERNSDVFRSACLGHLGNFVLTERERIIQRSPDLKAALEKQDRTALPNRDDADVKRARKLIDAIRDYKAALKKTADEVKDEQVKANLKKRLSEWEPAPDIPTK